MLLEFSVTNFKSIKEESRLSLIAGPSRQHEDSHVIVQDLAKGVRPIRLLRSAVIYGANAAGKTNLLLALKTMHDIVLRSSGDLTEMPVTPFRFDRALSNLPTTFEVTCIADRVRYQYGFSVTRQEVVEEWLYAWPKGRMQTWFERTAGGTSGEYSWKTPGNLVGDREVWKRATRPQSLFLSTAVSLNSKQLQSLFDWFRERLHVVGVEGWSPLFSLEYCESESPAVVDFLTAADLAVTDIRIVEKEFSPEMLPEDMPGELKQSLARNLAGTKAFDTFLRHQPSDSESEELHMAQESHGTQKMFALAGPWLDSLAEGNVVVCDELHDNLHPELVRFLVARFHDQQANKRGAQLIFSTHDTSILSRDVFRRDQVWFCERSSRLETTLFSLAEFRAGRGDENLERAYLGGRFGALPYIQRAGRPQSD